MAEEKFNVKNPAVKRILQEVKEMQNNPSDDYMSLPLEDNIFEWQFAIRGARDTEFESGIYHGRIQLPADYPLKPPSFMLLTPNGRFETNTKICLSISNYHPEHWQPSWSVRSALVALIAFLPTKPEGAVGSLDYPRNERMNLAIKSRSNPPKFGSDDRQRLIQEIHDYMLRRSPTAPENSGLPDLQANENTTNTPPEGQGNAVTESSSENLQLENGGGVRSVDHDDATAGTDTSEERNENVVSDVQHPVIQVRNVTVARHQTSAEDKGLTFLAIGLTIAIVAILIKKLMQSHWWISS